MKKPILALITITIVIAVIGTAINLVFGVNTVSYIKTVTANGITFKTYDFKSYLDTLSYQFNDLSKLQLELPPKQDYSEILGVLKEILNVIIFAINIMMYPLRVAMYIIGIILAILGINLQTYDNNPLAWLITLINTLTQLQIPYPN